MKKIMSLVLIVLVFISITQISLAANIGLSNFQKVNSYYDGMFYDVNPSSWYAENVKTAYELGLMLGNSNSTFNPSGNLTIAEALALACRLHNIYYGGTGVFNQGNPWYQVYVDYAIANNIISYGQYNYTTLATRMDFANILYSAFPYEAFYAINNVPTGSIPDVISSDAVYTLYRAGILNGSDSIGTFYPYSYIERNAVAAIVTRMASIDLRKIVEPKDISLNFNYLYIAQNESAQLSVINSGLYENNIEWSISEPQSANGNYSPSFIIDNSGKVTVISDNGVYATVTAKLPNGVSTTCRVMRRSLNEVEKYVSGKYYYNQFPGLLSYKNINTDNSLWNDFELDLYDLLEIKIHHYSYQTPTLEFAEKQAKEYARFLQVNGYTLLREEDDPAIIQSTGNDIIYELQDPSGKYIIQIKGTVPSLGLNPPAYEVDVSVDYTGVENQTSQIPTNSNVFSTLRNITKSNGYITDDGDYWYEYTKSNGLTEILAYYPNTDLLYLGMTDGYSAWIGFWLDNQLTTPYEGTGLYYVSGENMKLSFRLNPSSFYESTKSLPIYDSTSTLNSLLQSSYEGQLATSVKLIISSIETYILRPNGYSYSDIGFGNYSSSGNISDIPSSNSTPTMGEKNALSEAISYLQVMAFSREGLIKQLEFEGYTHSEAVYGTDHSGADWYTQAALSAASYLNVMSFSRQGLIEQLEYEGFTHAQAVYGVEQNGY